MATALLVVDNVLSNRALPGSWYLPTRLVTVVAMLVVAIRVGGCDVVDLGLDRSRVRRGAAWGGIAAAVILAVMCIAAAVPATADFFRDERAAGISYAGLAYQVLLRIPIGTVLSEELFFRGVILGLGLKLWSQRGAVLYASVLFGLWHVLPSQTVSDANRVLQEAGMSGGVVVSAVVFTAGAGVWFAWLRLRSGSVVAPMLVHLATNAGGFTLAWLVLRA